ncbi:MAG: DUF1631 family protein, partial [Gammaproteobacteria bacterium]|nr:DUF1631 family protein [Gammaproteobacteria bacterium]
MVTVYINALLSELFVNSDKALTSFAQKAENNEVQNRFFDAMSVIRNRHGLVEHEFRDLLADGFDNFWTNNSKPPGEGPDEEDSELELVDHDSMNEATALENIINKTVGIHRSQLYALGQRLTVINGGDGIKHHQIPAGPYHLVHAFNDAIDSLGLESRIKIIILALFDKYVMKQLGGLYEDFNNNLKDAGVLPHLRPTVQKSESAAPGGSTDEESAADAENQAVQTQEELGEELFENILDLMANRRIHSPRRGRPGAPAGQAAASGPPVSAQNLVSAISAIQPAQRADYIPDANSSAAVIPNIEVDEQFLTRIKHTLTEERHKLFAQIGENRLDAADEDTIDLVGMLFEYMLKDENLPNVVKALLSRLHTPLLKVAVVDRDFFTHSQHSARMLLNNMTSAGIRWVEENQIERGIF